MSKTLYVVNSPSYIDLHPKHTLGKTLISDPLSEHFTYVYYNLLKFGLVDKVVIFPRQPDKDKHVNPPDIVLDANRRITHDFRENKFDIINNDPGSYAFFYSNYDDCYKLKNTFVLFNPVTLTINPKNNINKKYHHYALVEGMCHENKYQVIPKDIPKSKCPLTSNQFTNLNVEETQKTQKSYDWIMVSSLDQRKRHVEFLQSIIKNPKFRNLRGCIAARNPDNKGYLHDNHRVLKYLNENFINKYDNIDFVMNVDNEEKIDLLSKSKIFVCTSVFDSGPRAIIEALQAGMPILTLPHIGSSDWIIPGKNGEFINQVEETQTVLYDMIEKYDRGVYTSFSKQTSELLKPENIYPSLIDDIRKQYKIWEST